MFGYMTCFTSPTRSRDDKRFRRARPEDFARFKRTGEPRAGRAPLASHPTAAPDRRCGHGGQISGMARDAVTPRSRFSGIPTRMKSVKR